jgi:alkylation response protein AidB-like acyl-CoA dehydrogenase
VPVERLMPTPEAADLIDLTREITQKEMRSRADEAERNGTFPRDVFLTLGRAGLLSLPYPEEYGGGAQPCEVYLQVLEEIAAAWASVGVGTSVHALSCFGLFHAGTEEQKRAWLPGMLGGELLGAYCRPGPRPAARSASGIPSGRLRRHEICSLWECRKSLTFLSGTGGRHLSGSRL